MALVSAPGQPLQVAPSGNMDLCQPGSRTKRNLRFYMRSTSASYRGSYTAFPRESAEPPRHTARAASISASPSTIPGQPSSGTALPFSTPSEPSPASAVVPQVVRQARRAAPDSLRHHPPRRLNSRLDAGRATQWRRAHHRDPRPSARDPDRRLSSRNSGGRQASCSRRISRGMAWHGETHRRERRRRNGSLLRQPSSRSESRHWSRDSGLLL
jgi:hypothetical protein